MQASLLSAANAVRKWKQLANQQLQTKELTHFSENTYQRIKTSMASKKTSEIKQLFPSTYRNASSVQQASQATKPSLISLRSTPSASLQTLAMTCLPCLLILTQTHCPFSPQMPCAALLKGGISRLQSLLKGRC